MSTSPDSPSGAETASTCPYCGVGCGVLITQQHGQITGVRGDPSHPANQGRLCTKGSTLHLTATAAIRDQARLLQPMRRAARGQDPQAIAWDDAIDQAATRIADVVQRHGPDAVGLYVSGQLLTEDYYVFNKLAKGLLGTNNIDTNSRLCMSSAVAGYKATLGADAPPACYDDLAEAHTVYITGANPAWAHPILFRRLEDARRQRPGQFWIVVDPRRTETAAMADLHLALRPGTDVALSHGLLHLMLAHGWTDEAFLAAHTHGLGPLRERVQGFTPPEVQRITGIAPETLLQAARRFATSPATLSLYCQGLNQSSAGTAKNAALINLHLASGQIGRPGAGPFSLTGQPNAMGGREVGGLANLLSAHRDLANPAHRAEVAALWGLDKEGREVPATPGKTAVEMFQAAADGQIKLLWIVCTNPAQSLPDQALVRRALQRAETVIVQEAFARTATTPYADLLLPATSWGEKDGTVTNSERRISRVRPAIPAPGQARHDWAIGVAVARRLEARLRPGAPTLFPYDSPESVWCEHRESTRGRDLDITGLGYALLDRLGPQQWPFPEGASQGRARLYTDGRFATADGRARLLDLPYQAPAETCDADYPVALTTGRLRDQWHGGSRTGLPGRLWGHAPEPTLDLHPQAIAALGLAEGALAEVRSRRGRLRLPLRADAGLAPDQAFIAMHWGDEVLGGQDAEGAPATGVNALTQPAFCPTSKQPELKHAAVAIAPAALPWTLLAALWAEDEAQALVLRQALAAWLPRLPYASLVPFGHQRHGLLLRAAAAAPLPADALQPLLDLLRLQPGAPDVLRYEDPARGQLRSVALSPVTGPAGGAATAADAALPRQLRALLLTGAAASTQAWLQQLLQDEVPVQALGTALLSPRPVQGAAPVRGRQVCSCFNVAEPAIVTVLARTPGEPAQRLAGLQAALRCGTQCGSCLPTLRQLLQATPGPVSAGDATTAADAGAGAAPARSAQDSPAAQAAQAA